MNGVNAAEEKKRYVLVVDADVDDRFYTCMLLQRFGYTIFSAHTTEKAIEFMTVSPPSAIVADADLNGSILLSWLTQDPRFFDIPLLLLSWWPNARLENRVRKGEFVAYLRKPVNVEGFYRVIQKAMEKDPRRNLRVASHLRGRLEDGLGEREGYVTALSEHGMFFRTLKPRPVNAQIPVAFEMKGGLIQLEAVVLYTIPFDEGLFKEPGMGMKFVKISRSDREQIAAFVLERIEEGIGRQSAQK